MKNKKREENNDIDDELEKCSYEDSGDAFIVALVTHACHTMCLIYFEASIHMSSHRD